MGREGACSDLPLGHWQAIDLLSLRSMAVRMSLPSKWSRRRDGRSRAWDCQSRHRRRLVGTTQSSWLDQGHCRWLRVRCRQLPGLGGWRAGAWRTCWGLVWGIVGLWDWMGLGRFYGHLKSRCWWLYLYFCSSLVLCCLSFISSQNAAKLGVLDVDRGYGVYTVGL